jgi:Nuclear pore protein 84 / 107
MYAGALGDNAVERYALFLTSLVLSVDPGERRTALQRAREHGLDVPRVAIVTAEHTIERALDTLPSSVKGPLLDLAKTSLESAEEAEMLLVRSIEWTVVEVETYDTALEQANVILRYLLGTHSPPLFFLARLFIRVVQLAGRSMWRDCSSTCSRQNWHRLASPGSAQRNILVIVSSLSHGRCSSTWWSVRHWKRHR